MKIGICDDEPIIVKALIRLIERSIEKINIKVDIIPFLSGSSLIDRAQELDVLFLDIEMPELDGFEVGKQIKNKNPHCKIIIATGCAERFKESFKINTFRFVTKPFEQCEIDEAIEAVVKLTVGATGILLYDNRIQYIFQQKNIVFFKAFNSYTEAFIDGKSFRRDLSLNEIENLLDERLFFRVHKQYIVNMIHIKTYKNCEIHIYDLTIPVSRRKKKEFEKKYMEYNVCYRG